MKPVRETEQELQFAESGWSFILVGAVLIVVLNYANRHDPSGPGSWIEAFVAYSFGMIFMLGGWWYEDLTLDLLRRTFSRRRGLWPFLRTTQGTFQDFLGLEVTSGWSEASRGDRWKWDLSLLTRNQKKTILARYYKAITAHTELERYARLLKLPAIDRTGVAKVITQPDELERRARK